MSSSEDFHDYIDGLKAFATSRSTEHNAIQYDGTDDNSGQISLGHNRCLYLRDGDSLKVWFLKPEDNPVQDQPNMNLNWTEKGWECETFLGVGLWENEELAQECVERLLQQSTTEDFKL